MPKAALRRAAFFSYVSRPGMWDGMPVMPATRRDRLLGRTVSDTAVAPCRHRGAAGALRLLGGTTYAHPLLLPRYRFEIRNAISLDRLSM